MKIPGTYLLQGPFGRNKTNLLPIGDAQAPFRLGAGTQGARDKKHVAGRDDAAAHAL